MIGAVEHDDSSSRTIESTQLVDWQAIQLRIGGTHCRDYPPYLHFVNKKRPRTAIGRNPSFCFMRAVHLHTAIVVTFDLACRRIKSTRMPLRVRATSWLAQIY